MVLRLSSELKHQATRTAIKRTNELIAKTLEDLKTIWKKRRSRRLSGSRRSDLICRAQLRGAAHYQMRDATAIEAASKTRQPSGSSRRINAQVGLDDLSLPCAVCDDMLRQVEVLIKKKTGTSSCRDRWVVGVQQIFHVGGAPGHYAGLSRRVSAVGAHD